MKDSNQQKNAGQASPSPALPDLCYQIAYFVLPKLLFSYPQRMIGYFTNPEYPAAAYLYVMATRLLQVEPVPEYIPLFKTHSGELSDERNYHILEYPPPPPFDLNSGTAGVLAPFFSAIIAEKATGEVSYYTLGQNPLQGTTLRLVTPDGANANLGPGSVPELDAFLEVLQRA